jgi:hypothetical protein
MLRRFRLITLLVVQHGLLLNEFDFSRAVRQKRVISGIAGKSVGWAGAAAEAKATPQSMQEMRELGI